jgi:hypothetical protein
MDANRQEFKAGNLTRITRIHANEFHFAAISEIRVETFMATCVHSPFRNS